MAVVGRVRTMVGLHPNMGKPIYSIVIPAYNEGKRIGATLEELLRYAGQQGWELEIIVVNDGSRDDTGEVVGRWAAGHACIRVLENPGNRGKGYSVRSGMRQAKGEVLLFTDADLSSPIAEAPRLLEAIRQGADVAIGSRWLVAEMQTRRQPVYRQFLGRLFNLGLWAILGLNFRDTQCGFKAFRRDPAQAIFARQRIERWGFDPELLFLARKLGLRTVEVPVHWAHDHRSKIHPLRDGLRMIGELLAIRWNDLAGRYAKAAKEKAV